MRILAVDLGAGRRGGQRQTLLVCRELAAAGDSVLVAALAGSPLASDAAAAGLAVFGIRPGGEASPAAVFGLRRAFRAASPDVVWVGDARAHGAAVWARLHRLAPLAVHRRVAFPPARHPLSRRKYALADLYLAVSAAVATSLELFGVPPARIRVVPDGLPPFAFRESSAPQPPPLRLVHAGAFDARKGQGIVVDLLGRLRARGVDATATFLGDGPARAEVEAQADAAGLAAACRFAGELEEPASVADELAGSHVLLLPSESEGAPLVLVEAMAAGCIPVAHDVGGCAEVIGGGAGGRLVGSLDPAAWEEAVVSLLALLADAPARDRLHAEGRRLAGERTIERTAARVREVLAELVRARAVATRVSPP